MKTPRVSVVLTAEEKRKVRRGFPAQASDSNVIRKHLNLDPVAHGGIRNGKPARAARAKKNGK